MRFLVDANLPPALAAWIVDRGHIAEHVVGIGLARASDREVWSYAKAESAVIVSKDEDFLLLRQTDPAGPKVIWVRLGNTTRTALLRHFESCWSRALDALDADGVVEIR